MLLTKKPHGSHGDPAHRAGSARFVDSLSRGLSNALPTMDRRAFLRRSGLGVGVGLAATQLTLVKKAGAAAPAAAEAGTGSGKIEVKRTVCTHCSVGCAIDAVVENGKITSFVVTSPGSVTPPPSAGRPPRIHARLQLARPRPSHA